MRTSLQNRHDTRPWRERLERRAFRAFKRLRVVEASRQARRHLFIAGLQRSGTNLLMEVLDWLPQTEVFHETDRRAFDAAYQMREPAVIERLAAASPAPVVVFKALCELDRLGTLLDCFEPARAVWMLRDFRSTSLSAVRSFRNFVPQMRYLAEGPPAGDWRGRGMSEATRALLEQVLREHPGELDGAAMMWFYRNVLYFEQGLNRDPRVSLLRYADLVRQPVQCTRRLCRFLGLPDSSDWATRHVHARSLDRGREVRLLPTVERACAQLTARFDALPAL